ncbi:MAG: DUF3108 domain-containing protein [Chitinophagaceae bacterium]|nr:DUF3108 domain-containing protein [Chitinophagaceae bacterium]
MKYLSYTFLLLLLIPVSSSSVSECSFPNKSTFPGEKLVYKIYYTLAGAYVGAGEATFKNELSTYDGLPCYHLSGEGHTYSSYDWFFKVRDLYESYVDTTTLLPMQFKRKVQEGNNRLFNSVIFNRTYNRATSTNGVFKIPDCVQDVLSSIYYARNIDFSNFKLNQRHHFQIFLDDKVEPVYIEYLGKFKLKTKHGSYNTIKFRPKLLEGTLFKGGDEMVVYVTDDERKIPVYIETPILVGKIKVYLISK